MSLTEWCASQPDLVRYRGECLIHRAEDPALRGAWADAEHDAEEACTLLSLRTTASRGRGLLPAAVSSSAPW